MIPIRLESTNNAKIITRLLVFICIYLCSSVFSYADTDWQVLKTEHFEVFYKTGYETKAKETLVVLTAYRDNVKKFTGNEIPKLRVVIEDIGTMSNAMADPLNPNIHIYIYPPDVNMGGIPAVGAGENWLRMAGMHEAVHIGQLTQSGGFPGILTTAFGNAFSPNIMVPGWIIEGTTVLGESQLSPYEGRLNDGFFNAVLRAYIQHHPFPTLLDMTYTPLDFPGLAGGPYLYGGLFLNYLREKYGQEKLNEFFKNQGESFFGWFIGWLFPAAGGIDYAAEKTYGKSFYELHMEWQNSFFYRQFAIDGNPLTVDKLALFSDLSTDGKNLCYIKREFKKTDAYNIYRFERIIRKGLVSGDEKELAVTTSFLGSKPYIISNKENTFLYYTVSELKRGYANSTNSGFGYISNLHCKNLATNQDRILFSDAIRAFTLIDDKQLLYTKDRAGGFGSEIRLYNVETLENKLLLESDYLIGQLTADAGYIACSARYDWENWGIYLFDINKLAFTELVNTPYAETTPSIHNNRILFVANYDKIYRIYAYDLELKKIYKVTQGSYANFPVLMGEELYFVGINGDGTNIYHKPTIYDEFKPPQPEQSKVPDMEKLNAEIIPDNGGYLNVLKTVVPYFRFPILSAKGQGAILIGQDVTYEHFYATSFRSGQDPRFNFLYENRMAAPLTLGLEIARKSGEQDTSLVADYPVYAKLEPGLSRISPSLEIRKNESLLDDHIELVPGISAGLKYPKWRLQGRLNHIAERESWDSPINRDGTELATMFAHYFNSPKDEPGTGSEFRVISYLLNDPDRTELAEFGIRGYHNDDTLKANQGGTLSLEYSFPIKKSRSGWWNPNIYWEDLSLVGFSDVAFGKGNDPNLSAGAELRLEMALGFSFRFVPALGIVVNKEGDSEFYLSFLLTSQIISGPNKSTCPK